MPKARKKYPRVDTKGLLALIEDNEAMQAVLESCRQCGITIQELAEDFLHYAEDTPHAIRQAIAWLEQPPKAYPPLLSIATPRLWGYEGWPPPCWLLTQFGAHMLNLLEPEEDEVKAASLRNPSELARWFYILKIQASLHEKEEVQVNQDLTCLDQQVHADLLFTFEGKHVALEIEQNPKRDDLTRAIRKLQAWEDYIYAAGVDGDERPWRVHLAFATTNHKVRNLVPYWGEALWQITQEQGELSYHVFHCSAADVFYARDLFELIFLYSTELKPVSPWENCENEEDDEG